LNKCEKHPNAAPYLIQIKTFREKWSKGCENGASPDTIAKAVLHAATSSAPKRRYAPNGDAKLGKFLKKWFGYGLIDRVLPGQSIK